MGQLVSPRLTKPPDTTAKRLSLADIATKPRKLPSRIILHGPPGVGKTSLPANAPNPVFICSKLETGVDALKDAGLVPESVGIFPEVEKWPGVFECLRVLREEPHTYKTAVFDVINGLEKMAHEYVCERDYDGKQASFMAYQAGQRVAVQDWRMFLAELDKLREARKMMVFLLCHTKVKNFKNPEGPDYDRYEPDLAPETWSVTHGWADIVLFANWDNKTTTTRQGKAKGADGIGRFLYTTRTAAYDAKNRDGLPEVISMGTSGEEAWVNFRSAFPTKKSE